MRIIWSEIAEATFVRFMADQAGMMAVNRAVEALVRPASNLVRYETAHRAAGMLIEWISLSAVPAPIADGRIRAACTVAALLLLYHARPG